MLGEMLELGRWAEPLHRDVGRYAPRCRGFPCSLGYAAWPVTWWTRPFSGMSQDAAYFFEDPEEPELCLRSFAREGDAILFKGSRGTRVERALDRFLERPSAYALLAPFQQLFLGMRKPYPRLGSFSLFRYVTFRRRLPA